VIDRYTLYQSDCLDILPTLEPGSIDAVITDPPYGVTITSMTKNTPAFNELKKRKWDNSRKFRRWYVVLRKFLLRCWVAWRFFHMLRNLTMTVIIFTPICLAPIISVYYGAGDMDQDQLLCRLIKNTATVLCTEIAYYAKVILYTDFRHRLQQDIKIRWFLSDGRGEKTHNPPMSKAA
jgi:tRNA G10  N-methylase Trm11